MRMTVIDGEIMTDVVVVGCGVIGAAIAYELSCIPEFKVTVLDQQPPARASTGAALGVLMGVISQKTKGNAWQLRQTSLQRYETLIPELEAIAGTRIAFNRQGILKLVVDPEERATWEALAEVRQRQGWQLEVWNAEQLQAHAPHLKADPGAFAVYSPQDRQINPIALTHALVAAARQHGTTFDFNTTVEKLIATNHSSIANSAVHRCHQLKTTSGTLNADWVILAAGLGTTPLLNHLQTTPLSLHPVLGQAVRVQLPSPLGLATFQPAFTRNDIHLVPLGASGDKYEYWVGATVEFPDQTGVVTASSAQLQMVMEGAIALCPALRHAVVVEQWSGLRPRPQNRPAPVIEPLAGYENVWLATGHYRNGVLLAPATALSVKQSLLHATSQNQERKCASSSPG